MRERHYKLMLRVMYNVQVEIIGRHLCSCLLGEGGFDGFETRGMFALSIFPGKLGPSPLSLSRS